MQFLKNNKAAGTFAMVLLCLIAIIFSMSCVSQRPKTQADVPEAVSEPATTEKTTSTENQQVAANPADEKPNAIIAMYRKSPSLKSVMAVLLLPQIPAKAGTSSSALAPAAAATPQAAATAQQTAPVQATPVGSETSAAPAGRQTTPASAQTTSAQGAQASAGSQAAAKPGAAPATPAKPPVQQPALPSAPASSTAAVTSLPASPVPNSELTVQKNQVFSVSLPGNGWIYLGDEQSRQGIRYESRQLIDNTILYRLTGDRTGEFLLRFQRDNPITQAPEFQYVKVTVIEPAVAVSASAAANVGVSGAFPAPANTPSTIGAAGTAGAAGTSETTGTAGTPPSSSTAAASTTSTAASGIPAAGSTTAPGSAGTIGTTETSTAGSAIVPGSTGTAGSPGMAAQPLPTRDMIFAMTDAASVLDLARTQLAQKQVSVVLSALERFLALSPSGSDEVLYLYALVYEQDTPYRDIQKSYQYYKQLVREYPLSTYRQFAMERIAYLERYYPGLR